MGRDLHPLRPNRERATTSLKTAASSRDGSAKGRMAPLRCACLSQMGKDNFRSGQDVRTGGLPGTAVTGRFDVRHAVAECPPFGIAVVDGIVSTRLKIPQSPMSRQTCSRKAVRP